MRIRRSTAFLIVLLFLYIIWYRPRYSAEILYETTNFFSNSSKNQEEENSTNFGNSTLYSLLNDDVCTLPQLDFFDPEIMRFASRPSRKCIKREQLTALLIDGTLVNRNPALFSCFGRCLLFETDRKNKYTEWKSTEENATFDCDIVEARCFANKTNDLFIEQIVSLLNATDSVQYRYMHTQIVERPIPKPEIKKEKQYSVYFLVVDSQAHTQLYRNMPRTLDFLLNTMKAINFPYASVFTTISRNNGLAWLYGKNTQTVDKKRYGIPSIEADPYWINKVNCNRSAEKDFNISLVMDFARRGYVTASVEDWIMLFAFGCAEYSSHPFHHIYNPYVTEYDKNYRLWNGPAQKECLPRHRHALAYLTQFVQSYKNLPKFAFTWLSHVGHNSEWGTKDLDEDMANFLRLNQKELDNSFVILAGDHGMRETGAASTIVGKLDVLNPALMIALPKELRENIELRTVMEENAHSLQTHFDTRATILDILKYQPSSNFTNHTLMNIEGELGHSYFRKQPGPRSCKHLPVHAHECICLQTHIIKMDYLKKHSIGSIKIAHFVNKQLNMEVEESENAKICDRWIVSKLAKLSQILENPTTWEGILHSTSVAKEKEAIFKFYLEALNRTDYKLISYNRLDLYGSRGDCVNHKSLAKVCECLSNDGFK